MDKLRTFVKAENVETQSFDWGKLQWLSEPRVTGAKEMVSGIVTLSPGKGHSKHNHPDCAEILFVYQGQGEQTVWTGSDEVKETVIAGELIYLQPSQFHSTINTGTEDMVIFAVYQKTGPEVGMRADPGCTVIPPEKP
jgi:oxalate decarboxylase/phosphoglucose isomerase-like protein (cupin superfamily)